jgi:hypothetical protein
MQLTSPCGPHSKVNCFPVHSQGLHTWYSQVLLQCMEVAVMETGMKKCCELSVRIRVVLQFVIVVPLYWY